MSDSVSDDFDFQSGASTTPDQELSALGRQLAKEGFMDDDDKAKKRSVHEQEGLLHNQDSPDEDVPNKKAPKSDPSDPEDEEEDTEEKIALKVNGKVIKKPLSEVIALAQQYEATQLKLETAKKEILEARQQQKATAAQQQAVRDLIQVMKQGDLETIMDFVSEKLGAAQQWNKAIVDYSIKLIEESRQSPEQREAAQNRKLIEKYKKDDEFRRQQEQHQREEYEVNRADEQINLELPKALALVGLPDTAFFRSQVISTWRSALEAGRTPTCAAVAQFVKKQLEDSQISIAPPQAKTPPAPPTRARATPDSVRRVPREEDAQYVSWTDWKNTRGKF